MLYLRNIKRGFATNSSSYHSTIEAWIDVPREIYEEFKKQHENTSTDLVGSNGGYRKYDGIILVDDFENEYKVYQDILEVAHGSIEVELHDNDMVRIKFDRSSDD